MARALSKAKTHQLIRTLRRLSEIARPSSEAVIWWFHTQSQSLDLGIEGYGVLREAVSLLQTVPAWKSSYPEEVIEKRLATSLFQNDSIESAVKHLTEALDSDCKDFVAYAPIFGFNLAEGVSIPFGSAILATIGNLSVESAIIARLEEHVAEWSEPSRSDSINHTRELLNKHGNVPILRVPFWGSLDGAKESVMPLAERVAAFMQFAIGVISDENEHIIDNRGRFTGEFNVLMPVMTNDFDELGFPSVRGNPHRIQLKRENVSRLEQLGVVALTEAFIQPEWAPRNAMDSLICSAISAFSDGERGVTERARIVSYVTSIETLVGRRGSAEESFAIGLAAATEGGSESFADLYGLAKVIYEQRSRAVHSGTSPTLTWLSRQRARQVIIKMITMREQLRTKDAIDKWIDSFKSRVPKPS